jgi:hypothetical protein
VARHDARAVGAVALQLDLPRLEDEEDGRLLADLVDHLAGLVLALEALPDVVARVLGSAGRSLVALGHGGRFDPPGALL